MTQPETNSTNPTDLPTQYDPKLFEKEVYAFWESHNYFHADPARGGKPYAIAIPPPNVTAALHLGHALNNTLQDILVRWRRQQGYNTLWMPGTDHAGIATQAVIEKRLLANEGLRRKDLDPDPAVARTKFVARVQAWKDEYEARILGQLKAMGCSCDWDRTRFTMDETCAAAVREAFFRLFKDGLIYRGKRLVNWDPATQTVLADDEVEHETVQGNFYYLRYPLAEAVALPSDTGILPVSPTGVPPVAAVSSSPSGTGVPPVSATGILPVEDLPVIKRQGANLPHWTQSGATYAITFRLADSLPAQVIESWKHHREEIEQRANSQGRKMTWQERKELHQLYESRIDSMLNTGLGACYLNNPEVAEIVQDALKHFHGERYELIAWSLMPNHIHAVLRPLGEHHLADIIHSWKSFTAKQANKILGREGQFWMEEYYDHLIRDEEDFGHAVMYAISHPERAGLADWPWVGLQKTAQGQDAPATHGQDARATVITHITVATTRPETMLGDTAVAMNPRDPRAAALVGQMVRLPIVGRLIPIIADEHVVLPNPEGDEKARFSTGFLKVTPAHDPNDWDIGQRHKLPAINVMAPDGSISDKHGWTDWDAVKNPDVEKFIGLDRFIARKKIVDWFGENNLLEEVRPYAHEVGHSYRSHVPIEPYLSDQWFIAVKKPFLLHPSPSGEGGPSGPGEGLRPLPVPTAPELIPGTDVPVNSLAGLAIKPLLDGKLKFVPERYARNYQNWLENLRDWPISRQLWWGHRIPVWQGITEFGSKVFEGKDTAKSPFGIAGVEGIHIQHRDEAGKLGLYASVPPGHPDKEKKLEEAGLTRDPDVLDTWFSSGLWPISTLGWPEQTDALKFYYPTSVLCTAREIITLWVSRMVMFGEYFQHDLPFRTVYIHAMIQDGEGRKMSKSLGNGIDPLDIIDSHGADAMRFTIAAMTTETQDVRMPVETLTLRDGRTANSSPKFDLGRNFCNKLWNASRFAFMNLAELSPEPFDRAKMLLEDRWILSRLTTTVEAATQALEKFQFHDATDVIYSFFWNDFCDWYLEITKPRMRDAATRAVPQRILAYALDRLLRLLHPFVPHITEHLWTHFARLVPDRSLDSAAPAPPAEACIIALWPEPVAAFYAPQAETDFALVQAVIRAIRNIRSRMNIAPRVPLRAVIRSSAAATARLSAAADTIRHLAALESLEADPAAEKPKASAAEIVEGLEVFVPLAGVIDLATERDRLAKLSAEKDKALDSVRKKLSNENFVARAKPEIVASERDRAAKLESELAALTANMKDLE